MKAKIVVELSGAITIITEEGTFEAGKVAINDLLATLKAGNLDVILSKPIEQHLHNADGTHVKTRTKQKS